VIVGVIWFFPGIEKQEGTSGPAGLARFSLEFRSAELYSFSTLEM
jgi:hypothetical protein